MSEVGAYSILFAVAGLVLIGITIPLLIVLLLSVGGRCLAAYQTIRRL